MIHRIGWAAAAAALLLSAYAPGALAGGSVTAGWLDMEKCQVCAPMMAEKGLFEHVHFTEHPIATGLLMVSSVDPEYEAAFRRSHEKMQGVIQRYMGGEAMTVCGHCASIKGFALAGAKVDELTVADRYITAVSATDPGLIAQIHAHAQRTAAEMQKMAQAQK